MQAEAQPTWTIGSLVKWATEDFRGRGIESARLDAELIVSHALSITRTQVIIDAQRPLTEPELAALRGLVKRRRAREPMAYVLGSREFYGRVFRVDRRVLIPRPDTETLVDVALERTRAYSMSMRQLDLCTGSGCVAITMARERPTARVTASDVSADALAVARMNAERLGAYNVAFALGDLFAPVSGARFDVVTANAPYIATEEIETLEPDVRDYEPRVALDGGADGLDLIRRIASGAPAVLTDGGVLALEVGFGEAPAAAKLLTDAGYRAVEVRRDLARIERVVSGVRPG